jgi:predicted transcriptional regulator
MSRTRTLSENQREALRLCEIAGQHGAALPLAKPETITALRKKGYILRRGVDRFTITPSGLEALNRSRAAIARRAVARSVGL